MKDGESYRCECLEGFLSAEGRCVESCGQNRPWKVPFNGMRVCVKSDETCDNRRQCMCDSVNGYALKDGACVACEDGAFVSSQYKCLKQASCESGEVSYGRLCMAASACKAAGRVLDITGTRCLDACNTAVKNGRVVVSEQVDGNGQCQCAKGFKPSREGFSCVKKGLTTAQILGIVFGCVGLVLVVVAVIVILKLCGKGGKKAPKSDPVQKEEPALAEAAK